MLLTLALGLLNAGISFIGNRLFRFSGFDIAPAGIIFLAARGENILFASLVLTLSYSLFKLRELRFLWLTLPFTIAIGFLSLIVPNALALIVLYHLVGVVFALLFGYFGVGYAMFMMINITTNLVIARLFGI